MDDAQSTPAAEPQQAEGAAKAAASAEANLGIADLHLKIGDRLQLIPPQRMALAPCAVRLIGHIESESLLVTGPVLDGLPVPLVEGDEVMVRLFSGQYAFAFRTFVEKSVKLPVAYLHLAIPKIITSQLIRKARRVKREIPGTLDGQECRITNLSGSGAEVLVLSAPEGSSFKLLFKDTLHGMEKSFDIACTVRTRRDMSKSSALGVEFEGISELDRVLLQGLVYQALVEKPELEL